MRFTILAIMGCLFISSLDAAMPGGNTRNLSILPGITNFITLNQNWTDEAARDFYNRPQGSRILPYKWFVHLEQSNGTNRFLDSEHIRNLGYLPRTPESPGNPDGLPIGFVQDGDSMGLTCAACHTGQIRHRDTLFLIDGGPTMANGEKLMRSLEAALRATRQDPQKYARFQQRVLSPGEDPSQLRQRLDMVIEKRAAYNKRNLPSSTDLQFGPGRIDAFGAILNEVAVRFANVPSNETKIDAPVSYPYLWDTPHHDFVQWNGATPNTTCFFEWPFNTRHVGALGRNVGEVIGVFADVDTSKDPGWTGGYSSTANKANLIKLEDNLRSLWSPLWPTNQFGNPNPTLVANGKRLFENNCAHCHQHPFNRTDKQRSIKVVKAIVGTDRTMTWNVATREGKTGDLKGRRLLQPPFSKLRETEKLIEMLSHIGQRVLIGDTIVPPDTEVPYEVTVDARIRTKQGIISGSFSDLTFKDGKLVEASGRSVEVEENGGAKTRLIGRNDYDKLDMAFKSQFEKKPRFSESLLPKSLNSATMASIEPDERAAMLKRVPSWVSTSTGTNQFIEAMQVDASFKQNQWVFDFRRSPITIDNVLLVYKARPLNGIWATAPYLHNGSIPNLDELLKECNERMKVFRVGSVEFDPINVGFRLDQGEFLFDTSAGPGNSNIGHDHASGVYKKVFDFDERKSLIEFLKTL